MRKKPQRGRDKAKKWGFALKFLIGWYKLYPKKLRKRVFERKRYSKGLYGIAVRYALLKSLAKSVGENVSIHQGCYLFNLENLEIGNNVSIHPMCYIEAKGGVTIGNDVSIAHAVTILSTTHSFDDVEIPIKEQPIKELPTTIADNVWIGAKATIIGGTIIGKGSVVGAASVVTRDVEECSVVVGVPARKIKNR